MRGVRATRRRLAIVGLVTLPVSMPAAAEVASAVASPSSNTPDTDAARLELQKRSILLVRTPGDEAVVHRVRAELQMQGWRIIELSAPGDATFSDDLERLAQEQVATAALRVDAVTGQIEIHIARSWGNIEETLRNDGGVTDAQVLAFRTTEALRAHGLVVGANVATPANENHQRTTSETGAPPRRQAASRAAPPKLTGSERSLVTASERPRLPTGELPATGHERLRLALAPAIVGSTGGSGMNFSALAAARVRVASRWSLALSGTFPLSSSRVSGFEGWATVASYLIGGAIERNWLRGANWDVALGLGAAAIVTRMTGHAESGFRGATDLVPTAGPFGYGRLGAKLSPRWRLFVLAQMGTSIPKVKVRFGEHEVATWGQPYALVALGLEFSVLGR